MSLVAVYNAFRAADVDEAKAAAAVEAIETVREESRLRRIEEQIAELRSDVRLLKWMIGVTITFMIANFTLTGAILLRLAS